MFKKLFVGVMVSALSAVLSLADGDQCRVSITDLDQMAKYLKEGNVKEARRLPRVLGSFSTTVGEERITTQHFTFPPTKERITASVYYTDESIYLAKPGSDMVFDTSISLALHISKKPVQSAFGQEGNASSELDYTKDTLFASVSKVIKYRGNRYAVDLDCLWNGARERD